MGQGVFSISFARPRVRIALLPSIVSFRWAAVPSRLTAKLGSPVQQVQGPTDTYRCGNLYDELEAER